MIIAFDNDHYYINPQVEVFYDVREFEELLKKFKAKNTSIYDQREISLQLLDLYKGDFLGDIDMEWSDTRRSELREDFIYFLEKMATIELNRESYTEARTLFEKAIEFDPYQDYLHLGLMKCLIKLKLPALAKKHYLNYNKKLQEDLKLDPVGELKDFYNSIN